MNVGFYDTANAGVRLPGKAPSGYAYQIQALEGCRWSSAEFVLAAALLPFRLPKSSAEKSESAVV